MRQAAEIAEKAKPEIIDINYGCPVKKVACKGAGAGILLDLPKMQSMTKEIVDAVNGVGASPSSLIAILEALKSAGSLRAELVVI